MTGSPLVVITVAFAAGIAAAYYSPRPLGFIGPAAGLAGVALVLGGALWGASHGARKGNTGSAGGEGGEGAAGWSLGRRPLAPLLLVLLFFFLGAVWGRLDLAQKRSSLLDDLHTHLYLTGRVVEEPRVYGDRTVYVLEAWEVRQRDWREVVDEKVEINVYRPREKTMSATLLPYRYGDVLTVHGRLELPPTARNPGEFDYRRHLTHRGVLSCMTVEPQDLRLVGHRPQNPVTELVLMAKTRALAAMEPVLPPREAGTLAAVLFGDQERLAEEDVDVYRSLGVYHVFAVSGQQVGFVLFLALAVASLWRLGRTGRLVLGLATLLFYMAITGFTPSVTRAGLMALTGLVAVTLGEELDLNNALAAAALAILVWRPYELLGPGFQLSFLATWGLIYLYPLFDRLLAFLPPWRAYLAVTLAAQTAVLWHSAYYFNLVPVSALVANLVVLPVIGAVTILGLLLLYAGLIVPAAGAVLAQACGGMLYALTWGLARLAAVKGAALSVASPPWWTGILYVALLVGARESWRLRAAWVPALAARKRYVAPLLLGAGLLAAVLLLLPPQERSNLEVVFLDVGQGDATYIRTPAGRNVLVDGGGRPDDTESARAVGEKVVYPYLVKRGVRHLDLVVSTHPDADHLQGLIPVLQRLPVGLVVLPPAGLFGNDYEPFLNLLRQRGVRWQEAGRGCRINLDPGLTLTVMHPGQSGQSAGSRLQAGGQRRDERAANDYSLVLKLVHGANSILLAGDIEAAAMTGLLSAFGPQQLRSNVFKAPHHGSAYSLQADFLDAVAPQMVVVQVGTNNYGHPAPGVLAFWRSRKVPVYRTDRHGAISLVSDGHALTVKTFLPGGPA